MGNMATNDNGHAVLFICRRQVSGTLEQSVLTTGIAAVSRSGYCSLPVAPRESVSMCSLSNRLIRYKVSRLAYEEILQCRRFSSSSF